MTSVDQRGASRPIVVAPVSAIVGVLGAVGVIQLKDGGESAIEKEIETFRSQNTEMVATVTRIEGSAQSAAEDISELKNDFKTTNRQMLERFDRVLALFAEIKPEVTANTGRSIRNERDIDRINSKIEQLRQPVNLGDEP